MIDRLIISCEHGGNRVPAAYRQLFAGRGEILDSHRGWDPGSLALAKTLSRRCRAPLFAATVTRLLVELNRSLRHPRLFSEFSRSLPVEERRELLRRYYEPHRRAVEDWIGRHIAAGHAVCHISVHTFTPSLDGKERRADIGLLYDPRRPLEHQFSVRWQRALRAIRPDLVIRRNYPYLGRSDGFTTWLRRRFADPAYAGIELEINQRWPLGNETAWGTLQRDVTESLVATLRELVKTAQFSPGEHTGGPPCTDARKNHTGSPP